MNKRNYTMFWHLYDALKHDDECLIEVAGSVLGLNEIKNLHAMLEGEIPLEPREIYGFTAREIKAGVGTVSAADAKDHALTTFERWKRDRRTDLVGVTLQWLANDLNDKDTNLADDQLDALFEKALVQLGQGHDLRDLGLEAHQDFLRRAGGREQFVDRIVLVAGQPRFVDRRHVGEQRRALFRRDAERTQLARAHVRRGGADLVEHHRDLAADDFDDRLRVAFVLNRQHLDAGLPREQFTCDVARRADAR